MVKWKVFIRRDDLGDEALDKMRIKSDQYEVDLWDGPVPMPRQEFLNRVKGCSGIIASYPMNEGEKVDQEVIDAAGPSLKVVVACSAGYDHIDVDAMHKAGIRVGHSPNVLDQGVAEHTMTLILMSLYRVQEHIATVYDESKWINHFDKPLYPYGGRCLYGKTVGIVGLGGIGVEVAKRLSGFDVGELLYTSRIEKPKLAASVGAAFATFPTLLEESDVIVIACSLNESTQGMFNSNVFKRMKKTAILINIARGGIINQDDLEEALKSGEIGFAALDVTTPEPLPHSHSLLRLTNCLVTPHMAPSAKEVRSGVYAKAVDNVMAVLEGHEMPAEVFA